MIFACIIISTHDLSVHTLRGLAFNRGQSHDKRFNTEDHHFFMCRQVTRQREDCKNGCFMSFWWKTLSFYLWSDCRSCFLRSQCLDHLKQSTLHMNTNFTYDETEQTRHDLLTICFTWSLTCSSNVSHLCWCCILMVGSFEVSAFLSCKPAAILATWDLPPSANSFTKATKNWG